MRLSLMTASPTLQEVTLRNFKLMMPNIPLSEWLQNGGAARYRAVYPLYLI